MATIDEKVDALIRGLKTLLDRTNPVNRRPASSNFFSPKGGQLQFAVGSPRWSAPEERDGVLVSHVAKEGAVFIEGAPPDPTTEGRLDWKNKKIVFALSDKDIAAIIDGIETLAVDRGGNLVNLTHTTGPENAEIVKYFKIKPGTADRNGNPTYLMELADTATKNRVSVFVGRPELTRLRLLLTGAICHTLGWT